MHYYDFFETIILSTKRFSRENLSYVCILLFLVTLIDYKNYLYKSDSKNKFNAVIQNA